MSEVDLVAEIWNLVKNGNIEKAEKLAKERMPAMEADYLIDLLKQRIQKPKELEFVNEDYIPTLVSIYRGEGVSSDFIKILKSVTEEIKNEVLMNLSEVEKIEVLSSLTASPQKLGEEEFSHLAEKIKVKKSSF